MRLETGTSAPLLRHLQKIELRLQKMLLLLDGLAKLEVRLRGRSVRAPRWQALAIGITRRGEVHPVTRHRVGQLAIRVGVRERRILQVREDVLDLCRVVRATCFRFGPWRHACELVEERLHPRRCDHARPRAHLEAEDLVATECEHDAGDVSVLARWICLVEFLCETGELYVHPLVEVCEGT